MNLTIALIMISGIVAQMTKEAGSDVTLSREYFFSEYQRALADLKASYSQGYATGTYKSSKRQVNNGKYKAIDDEEIGAVDESARINLKKKGENSLLELRGDKPSAIIGPRQIVLSHGSKYSFALEAKPDLRNGTAVLKSFTKATGGPKKKDAFFGIYLEPVFKAPFDLQSDDISSLLNHPDSIKDISAFRENGKIYIKANFYHNHSKKYDRYGYFVVSPEEGWALVKYDTGLKDLKTGRVYDHCVGGINEYALSKDRPPILRKVQCFLFAERREYEFDRFDLGPVSDDEFTLAAYGLPEIGESPRRRNFARWYLGIGLIVAVIGVGFRYLSIWLRKRKPCT